MIQHLPPRPDDADLAASFATVFEDELIHVAARRDIHRTSTETSPASPRDTLAGLALSGGGIRSATFALGVLQALHARGVLHLFDYLSTVSGGGFAGGWWTAWLSRPDITRAHLRSPEVLAGKLEDAVRVPAAAPGTPDAGGWMDRTLARLQARSHETRTDVESALDALRTATPASRGEHERALEIALVSRLRELGPRDQTLRRYEAELERLFPRRERIDSSRAVDYCDDRIPDGAIAAGADPIHHLRLFANYLTPRKGLLSPDTWRAAAVITRNLSLTWLLLVPILIALIFAGQLLFFVMPPFTSAFVDEFVSLGSIDERAMLGLRPLAVIVGVLAFVTAYWMYHNNAGNRVTHLAAGAGVAVIIGGLVWGFVLPRACAVGFRRCVAAWWGGPSWGWANWAWVALTLLLVLALWVWIRWRVGPGPAATQHQVRANVASRWHGYLLTTLVFVAAVLTLAGFGYDLVRWAFTTRWSTLGSSIVSVATAVGAIYTALKGAPAGGLDTQDTEKPSWASRVVFAAMPVLVLLVLALASAWLARHAFESTVLAEGTRIPLLTLIAVAGFGVSLVFAAYEIAGPTGTALLPGVFAVGGLGAVLVVLCAFWRDGAGPWWMVFDHRFLIGISINVVFALAALWLARVRRCFTGRVASVIVIAVVAPTVLAATTVGFWAHADNSRIVVAYIVLVWLMVTAMWVIAFGWMADPNALALHAFYKARLVRAYLGASNPNRRAEGADINDPARGDDMPLVAALSACEIGGPLHLVNTTLNLVGGRDLTTAQRTAASFVLSPLFCGSVRTGYRPTGTYMDGKMSLGAAISASGAAASPNMGTRTPSAALAMLLAFFNVRLGLWAPTPDRAHWRSPQARVWPYYLLRESLLQTNDRSSYCYLTDGGHFDNTGVYSLIERGCRYIVVVDDGADPQPCFEDMGDVIRRCRIDFDADIVVDASGFQKTATHILGGHPTELATITMANGRTAAAHFTVGTIHYADAHLRALGRDPGAPDAKVGTIVWIKPALTGEESVDVTQYGLQNASFPQQSTADQWFDEAQFESYRRLGYHSGFTAFAAAASLAEVTSTEPPRVPSSRMDELFRTIVPRRDAPERARLHTTVRWD